MIYENNNFIEQQELDEIHKVCLSDRFPYFIQKTTSGSLYAGVSHNLIERHNPYTEKLETSSTYYDFFYKIWKRFNEKNNIPHKKWARGALNFTLPMPTIEMGTPHIDHDFEHKVMIMYLNEFTEGNTIIFKDKYNGKDSNTENWSKPPVIDTEIKSEMGKVFVFDGLQYHANRFPGFGTHRLTCVITYI